MTDKIKSGQGKSRESEKGGTTKRAQDNSFGKANAREIVLDMLQEILEEGKFSHTVINRTLSQYQYLEKQERAFISRLCTGTVKRYLTLDYRINQVASLPVRKMKPLIRNILRMSVYQLLYMDHIPESAACNEAVKLAKKRGLTKLSGFINAVLREIIRKKDMLTLPSKETQPAHYLEIAYSVPGWLAEELLSQYEFDQVEKMLSISLDEKKTSIRCNGSKIEPHKLKQNLLEEGVAVEDCELLDYAFFIRDYDYLEKLEAFRRGYFAVQDISSMLVCQIAGIKNEDLVVDVCAAPGGKALHAAETAKLVSARDLTDYKVRLIEENKARLGITNVVTKVWDATVIDPEMVGKADIVIADLPCSGLGVLGKKADIKYRLSHEQLGELVQLQRKILTTIKEYVKPGGILIYSTCTVNKEENIKNRDWFLQNYDFETESLDPYLPEQLQGETTKMGYLQLLQGVHPTDGFFLSRMRRKQ